MGEVQFKGRGGLGAPLKDGREGNEIHEEKQ